MADINVEYINVFLMAAAQVMKDVCQMNLSIGRPYVKQTEFENETVVVNIGITGQLRGLVLLAMPKEVACDIASRMCFMTIEKLDEISLSAKTTVCELRNGNLKTYEINPSDYGFSLCDKSDLTGGTPQENAQITKDILNGAKGPKTDAVILNAAAGIYIAKDDITYSQAIDIAKEILNSGKAAAKLESFIKATN